MFIRGLALLCGLLVLVFSCTLFSRGCLLCYIVFFYKTGLYL